MSIEAQRTALWRSLVLRSKHTVDTFGLSQTLVSYALYPARSDAEDRLFSRICGHDFGGKVASAYAVIALNREGLVLTDVDRETLLMVVAEDAL